MSLGIRHLAIPAAAVLAAAVLVAASLAAGCAGQQPEPDPEPAPRPVGLVRDWIEHDGLRRYMLLYIPQSLPPAGAPLVICLPGAAGPPELMAALTEFGELAEEEGFLVVFPQAVEQHWNDRCGDGPWRSHREQIDDVGYIAAVIDRLADMFALNGDRVFATGIADGATMSHRLAIELSDRIRAIAAVSGGLSEQLADELTPSRPVDVLIMQGTDDALVPYEGGQRRWPGGAASGRMVGAETAARLWVEANGLDPAGVSEALPDAAPDDGCHTLVTRWSVPVDPAAERSAAGVVLYRIEGGGHNWPGSSRYRPLPEIGNITRDFQATRVIWEFFRDAHPPPSLAADNEIQLRAEPSVGRRLQDGEQLP